MNGILSLIVPIARQYLTDSVVRPAGKRLAGTIAVFGLVAFLALAALGFFYVALDRLVTERLGELWAAAILLAANLALILLIFAWRAIAGARRRAVAQRAAADAPELALAAALTKLADQKLRKGAPEIALAALALGLIVTASPEIASLVRRRGGKRSKRDE